MVETLCRGEQVVRRSLGHASLFRSVGDISIELTVLGFSVSFHFPDVIQA